MAWPVTRESSGGNARTVGPAGARRSPAPGRTAVGGPAPTGATGREAGTVRVSVVICAYSDLRWEDLCVLAQRPMPDEVIVVIDHNDALLAAADEAFDGVRVLASTGPRGLSGARNTGVGAARGDIVAFLDDDAVARPAWLSGLTGAFADPDVVGVGGAVRPAWTGRRPAWMPPAFDWVVGCSYEGLPRSVAPIRNPIGASMAYRRDRLVDLGGFSDHLGRVGLVPFGCEETELSIRAVQRWPGARHLYVPDAVVDHRVPEWRGTWRYLVGRCYREGVSKARVARLVGAADSLSAERAHLARVLPAAAVVRPVLSALRTRSPAPLAQTAAVLAGLGAAAAGYVVGTAGRRPVASGGRRTRSGRATR